MIGNLRVLETYVAGQARLGYAKFDPGPRPSDVLLVSFPKSGSTWTSYLLHQLRSGGDHEFVDIKHEVVDITPGHWDPQRNPFEAEQRFRPRTFKTHGGSRLCPQGGRYIYLARDPRDSFYSLYCFMHDLFGLAEWTSPDEFFRHYYVERFGSGHDIGNVWTHLLDWYRHKHQMLWLHYEDLLEDLPRCLRCIADFAEIDLSEATLGLVLERSTISAMRQIGSKLNPSPDNYVGRIVRRFGPETATYAQSMRHGKMRRGVAGDGSKNLPPQSVQALDTEWNRRIRPVLGYDSYAEMREDCSLLRQA